MPVVIPSVAIHFLCPWGSGFFYFVHIHRFGGCGCEYIPGYVGTLFARSEIICIVHGVSLSSRLLVERPLPYRFPHCLRSYSHCQQSSCFLVAEVVVLCNSLHICI